MKPIQSMFEQENPVVMANLVHARYENQSKLFRGRFSKSSFFHFSVVVFCGSAFRVHIQTDFFMHIIINQSVLKKKKREEKARIYVNWLRKKNFFLLFGIKR